MEISPELILGIVGSVTGISSLLIEFKKYLRDRPRIQAEIVNATHQYSHTEITAQLTFKVQVRIRNKGDKGITIGEVIFEAKTERGFLRLSEEPSNILGDERGQPLRVSPNDDIPADFEFVHFWTKLSDKFPTKDEIPFVLILSHARGETRVKGTSIGPEHISL